MLWRTMHERNVIKNLLWSSADTDLNVLVCDAPRLSANSSPEPNEEHGKMRVGDYCDGLDPHVEARTAAALHGLRPNIRGCFSCTSAGSNYGDLEPQLAVGCCFNIL